MSNKVKGVVKDSHKLQKYLIKRFGLGFVTVFGNFMAQSDLSFKKLKGIANLQVDLLCYV